MRSASAAVAASKYDLCIRTSKIPDPNETSVILRNRRVQLCSRKAGTPTRTVAEITLPAAGCDMMCLNANAGHSADTKTGMTIYQTSQAR